MSNSSENFEHNSNIEYPQKLADDLKSLYEPPFNISGRIDQNVLSHARAKFGKKPSLRRLRWAGAAAAAVFMLIFLVDTHKTDTRNLTTGHRNKTSPEVVTADVNQSGRVDILDAFNLARNIKLKKTLKNSWDIDGNGKINQDDVDSIAMKAVRLHKGVL